LSVIGIYQQLSAFSADQGLPRGRQLRPFPEKSNREIEHNHDDYRLNQKPHFDAS
jgi:hypothetical protein